MKYHHQLFQSTLPREERRFLPVKEVISVLISIHAPTRGATNYQNIARAKAIISIHAPTRGATVFLIVLFMTGGNFNPRSHERSDIKMISDCSSNYWISIHAPTRGATLLYFKPAWCSKFQSTLPREERPEFMSNFTKACKMISIHAPTRGATQKFDNDIKSVRISIHAPTRGATVDDGGCSIFERYFNPRSHERSDDDLRLYERLIQISIHAPTRGATRTQQERRTQMLLFQSTLPREERRQGRHHTGVADHFNPRSHERSDTESVHDTNNILISIHAPTRGATS